PENAAFIEELADHDRKLRPEERADHRRKGFDGWRENRPQQEAMSGAKGSCRAEKPQRRVGSAPLLPLGCDVDHHRAIDGKTARESRQHPGYRCSSNHPACGETVK